MRAESSALSLEERALSVVKSKRTGPQPPQEGVWGLPELKSASASRSAVSDFLQPHGL